MIRIHNKIIRQKQVIRKKTREQTVPEYEKGNWVFLKRNSERKDRSSQIFDHKYWKLFQIKKQVNEYSYELDLSRSIKIYLIFEIYRLKKVHKQQH